MSLLRAVKIKYKQQLRVWDNENWQNVLTGRVPDLTNIDGILHFKGHFTVLPMCHEKVEYNGELLSKLHYYNYCGEGLYLVRTGFYNTRLCS